MIRHSEETKPIHDLGSWVRSCLWAANATLSAPPVLDRLTRPSTSGDRVARIFLPLELCQPQNRKRGAPPWQAMKQRKSVAHAMAAQCCAWAEPLPGRPQVICYRFSSTEPDRYSDWAKVAVDVLCAPTARCSERLNIIHDDAPKYTDVVQHWEPAKRGEGFVMIEVWTGEAT